MDGNDLLQTLHGVTEFESVGDAPQRERPGRSRSGPRDLSDCITNVMAGNRKMPVLKAMSTTACERDCLYCPFRAGRSSSLMDRTWSGGFITCRYRRSCSSRRILCQLCIRQHVLC